MMKIVHKIALLSALSLTACSAQTDNSPILVGGEKDEYGCLPAAGYSWSKLKQECVQPFSIADIKLDDPANDTLAVYVILSADRSQAEVFAADFPSSRLLDAVKGGYLSQDKKVRLLKTPQGWKIRK
ncbi:hypothetical protein [Caviibacterium pharyngocola]|uniref:Lipoprotein n=1 Tax=Caviibacterium pharyngocola TaxID=28159 RepID=A0A2M8RYA7_9PAST|nr:hypothetical protein [Caviibacterium pharyngocola]PJG83871.1 hypothetical protein CVP04_01920 [Caviibacterium pharyngocola]